MRPQISPSTHAGVRRGCYAPLRALASAAARAPVLKLAIAKDADLWGLVMAGACDSDTLARKRCRECVQDLAALQAPPEAMPAEVWGAVEAFWAHWLALYDSLSGYALELVQPTWKAHLPGLLAAVGAASGAAGAWGVVPLRCSVPGSASNEQNWLSVLFNQGMKHQNPLVQRFLATCMLGAAMPRSEGLFLPDAWLPTDLAAALSKFEVTGGALQYLAEVCSAIHALQPMRDAAQCALSGRSDVNDRIGAVACLIAVLPVQKNRLAGPRLAAAGEQGARALAADSAAAGDTGAADADALSLGAIQWSGPPPEDLCSEVEALFTALGQHMASSPTTDGQSSLQVGVARLSDMLKRPKLGRSAAAALCVMLAALVRHAEHSEAALQRARHDIVRVIEHLQLRLGAEATPMVHELISAMRAASGGATLSVQAAVLSSLASAVPLHALQEDGAMRGPLCAWANSSTEMQGVLCEGALFSST